MTSADAFDVESIISIPLPAADGRWVIRFNADKTVTIVLGVRDYGRGWFSGYFAGLVEARLGIPFHCIRIYYSAQHPAVMQTPLPSPGLLRRGEVGPFASAVAEIIEALCDEALGKARLAFAAMAAAADGDVAFDSATARFFIMDRNRSRSVMEMVAFTHAVTAEAASEFPDPSGGMGRCNE